MAASDPGGPVLASFVGGFYYRFQVAAPQTRAMRLDILPTGVRIAPTSRVARLLFPRWAANYDNLEEVRIRKRFLSVGIRFRSSDGKVFEFRPLSSDILHDAVEPVVAVLREAGVTVLDYR